jgi:hypothetical protein
MENLIRGKAEGCQEVEVKVAERSEQRTLRKANIFHGDAP